MKSKNIYWLIGIIVVLILGIVILPKAFTKKTEYVEFTDSRPVRGNPEASVIIVEWSDFECPACGMAQPVIEEVLDKYQDQVKLEFHHFPLSYHAHAYQAAEASECANDQGKFWEYLDQLFTNQSSLASSDLKIYAERVGLDLELFEDCLSSNVKEKYVDKDLEEGKRLGIGFTPSIFVNGQLVEDWSSLGQIVEALIEPVKSAKKQNSSSDIYRE